MGDLSFFDRYENIEQVAPKLPLAEINVKGGGESVEDTQWEKGRIFVRPLPD
jgi:hypothetical protein